MMKSLGFYFDQVARERMTERIASRVAILADGTPADQPIGADRVVWVETLHPVSHELTVSWTVDGTPVSGTGNARSLDLRSLRLAPGTHTVTATVTDPTPFVRDPAVRESPSLTQRRTWTVDTALTTPRPAGPWRSPHRRPPTGRWARRTSCTWRAATRPTGCRRSAGPSTGVPWPTPATTATWNWLRFA